MSITSELREWMDRTTVRFDDRGCLFGTAEELTAIADRIDAEHERQCAESWMRGHDAWAAIDRSDEMAEHGWVRLPVDADGETIHVGDVMEWPTTHETFEVVGIGDGTLFYVEDGNECADWTGASTKRHHHAPTVEDVLREFVSEFNRDDTELCDEEIIERFAAKLRLAGDAE